MKIKITGNQVELDGRDEDGSGFTRSMSLEQYEKHARDPEFVAAIPTKDHAEILAARRLERELEAAARQAAIDVERAALDEALKRSGGRRIE